MNKLHKLRAIVRDMENDLGIWADIIGCVCLFGLIFGLLVLV
jgi:hypothetical protein